MQTKLKTCKACGQSKSYLDYYVNKGGNLTGRCKPCYRAKVAARAAANAEKIREYDRLRSRRVDRREKALEYQRQRRARDPVKNSARHALNNAIQRGRIVPPLACSRCRATGVDIEGHHTDYTRPLEVEWLCFLCHRQHGHGQSVQGLVN